jgi:hypothetical protein
MPDITQGKPEPQVKEDNRESPSFWKTQGLLGIIGAVAVVVAALITALATGALSGGGSLGNATSSASTPTVAGSSLSGSNSPALLTPSDQPEFSTSPDTGGMHRSLLTLTADPASGSPGITITVTGKGFGSLDFAIVVIDAPTWHWQDQAFPQNGDFQAPLSIPSGTAPGKYAIQVQNSYNQTLATTQFQVT